MSNAILIIGESGAGKSTSIRNLNPTETFIINVINKPLPFKSYRKNYTKVTKENPNGNYTASDEYDVMLRGIAYVNEKMPHIKSLIIDDFQYVMANEFMRRSSEKGWEKFTEIGEHAWKIIDVLKDGRDDLDCFVLSHSDTTDAGKVKCKTIGKMLDDKICLEGMFSIVFHAIMHDGVYKFLTQNDGTHIAKSPMGMFENKWIENDLLLIKQKMSAYFNEPLEDIKM